MIPRMAIDTSKEWWTGTEASDLNEYLRAYSAENYALDEFRLAICDCGINLFHLHYHADEGVARRTCTSCGTKKFIADSEDNWQEVRPKRLKCVHCPCVAFNMGVGFSLYDDKQNIRWIYVGARCPQCGLMGCFAEWKIGYEPSLHLLDKV